MTTPAQERTEEERAEMIAVALTGLGLEASTENTGIAIPLTDGGAIFWGAAIVDEDGKQTASISTEWPSDSEDIEATAKALLEASLRNGAVLAWA